MLLTRHPSQSGQGFRKTRGGWTLLEMLVAVGAGTIILIAFVAAFVTLSNTMVAIDNYNELDSSSRHTLDLMNQDLRNTATVTAMSSTSVTATNIITGDQVRYWWDSSAKKFSRQTVSGGTTTTTMMLTNCDVLAFSFFTRVPTNNFTFVTNSSGDPTQTKLLSVSWRCSRTVLGLKLNTESVQTARICIRN
jgi:type II secretory pathway component PulJ